MTPAEHLTHVHAEAVKIAAGFTGMRLDVSNPVELDRLALVARTVGAAAEALAERAEGLASILLDQA